MLGREFQGVNRGRRGERDRTAVELSVGTSSQAAVFSRTPRGWKLRLCAQVLKTKSVQAERIAAIKQALVLYFTHNPKHIGTAR